MKKHTILWKNVGETPLEALRAWVAKHPQYANVPMSYAGRLDPMAEGKLLILLGDECKKQKKYAGLDKEYEIEVLLDVGSDTGDALGLVEYPGTHTSVEKKRVRQVLCAEHGAHMRAYPIYSSKTVDGKPLFLHALEGSLSRIEIPQHEEKIYKICHRKTEHLSAKVLRERVKAHLAMTPTSDEPSKILGADFRIKEVVKSWGEVWESVGERDFSILTLTVACGSGTYMRSLAPRTGEGLGTKALALSIKRTRIGKYWNGLWYVNY